MADVAIKEKKHFWQGKKGDIPPRGVFHFSTSWQRIYLQHFHIILALAGWFQCVNGPTWTSTPQLTQGAERGTKPPKATLTLTKLDRLRPETSLQKKGLFFCTPDCYWRRDGGANMLGASKSLGWQMDHSPLLANSSKLDANGGSGKRRRVMGLGVFRAKMDGVGEGD